MIQEELTAIIHTDINAIIYIGLRTGFAIALVFGFTGWFLSLSFNLLNNFIK